MSDTRRINQQRIRRWGDAPVTLAVITSEDQFSEVAQVSHDWSLQQVTDEQTNRQAFRFCFYGECVADDVMPTVNLLIFGDRRFERQSCERKPQFSNRWEILAVVVGAS